MSERSAGGVLGVIPARGGSKGIPRKNHLELGGRTLLELAIASARESALLTRTVVSTEDPELEAVARAAGGDVPFRRPAALATDTAGSWAVVRHAVEALEAEGWRADVVVLLQPTTPFRRGGHIDAVIRPVLEGRASSALTIRRVDYPPVWMLRLGEGRVVRPYLEDGGRYSRRQDTPPAYQPNGLVYAMTRTKLLSEPRLPDVDTVGVEMGFEESVNIDELWQYRLAQMLWPERGPQAAEPERPDRSGGERR